ncbi:DUF4279 domain-containing protein [Agreia sp. PsM10]|uniref:DUF4279 domain-containing protein n=1 Tax=Agreia sp. PsM10 TaxID=3030533 RepID=UPI00263B5268|nr:DUF4279 domain-containing protein [Agreia sp. PsM10]MDN4639823.1 DUF4279 domain-containing protein [Agreia sp. PsM10]
MTLDALQETVDGWQDVYLTVLNDTLTRPELASALQMIPDVSVEVGEPTNSKGPRKVEAFTSWIVHAKSNRNQMVDLQLAMLWTVVGHLAPAIAALPGETRCYLNVHHIMNGGEFQGHGINLSSEWIGFLAQVHGEFDVDQYVVEAERFRMKYVVPGRLGDRSTTGPNLG